MNDCKDCEQYCSDNPCCTCRNREWYRLYNDYKAKEQECEELKNFHINLVGVKECEIRELVKYKQALTEIKEIINICRVNNCNSECEFYKMDDCQDERLYRIRQILQKCEVLDE